MKGLLCLLVKEMLMVVEEFGVLVEEYVGQVRCFLLRSFKAIRSFSHSSCTQKP
jgi:hypothetical protein